MGWGRAGSPRDVGYLKVRWLWLQRRPVSAYRFRRMLDFIRAPNWSGTPQRGRFIHLPGGGGHQARAQPTVAKVPEGLQQPQLGRELSWLQGCSPQKGGCSSHGRQHPHFQVQAKLWGWWAKPKSPGVELPPARARGHGETHALVSSSRTPVTVMP